MIRRIILIVSNMCYAFIRHLFICLMLLEFIREFLWQLNEISDTDKTSMCCQDAYNKTLAKHHPWVVRKAAIVAMYTMPTRELLFQKV